MGMSARYQRVADLVHLAIKLQGSHEGLTLEDISTEFNVSRRTAERMRDAVDAAFGPLEIHDGDGRRRHMKLPSSGLRGYVRFSPEEIAGIESSSEHLQRAGLTEQAKRLRELVIKIRAAGQQPTASDCEDQLEMALQAEGFAMRPGPRPQIDRGLLQLIHDAIKSRKRIEFDYVAQSTKREQRHSVAPYGVLYGNRPYLVGCLNGPTKPRLWRISNISDARISMRKFEPDDAFDLRTFAEGSFGAYQETPIEVVLRFDSEVAEDASNFLFHPTQTLDENPDGSLSVKFTAGGTLEMCWHLVTWGRHVVVEEPAPLREELRKMCAMLAEHHDEPHHELNNRKEKTDD